MAYEVLESGGRYEVLGDAPTSVKAGAELNSIPRQLGLTARYGIEGLANTAQIVTEPIRAVTDLFTPDRKRSTADLITGQAAPPKSMPLGAVASQFADFIGLPRPATANERTIGEGTKLLAGAGGLAGAARGAANLPGAIGQAGEFLSANLSQQLGSAAGAGLAGGASREAGGGTGAQVMSSLVGGVAGGLAPGGINRAVNTARNLVAKPSPQQVDQQINVILQRAEIDPTLIPSAVRASLRNDIGRALQAGEELNPDAVRRLVDFRLVGATPTRGMVTQDPVQITREMNLAKTGANSANGELQGLARIQNQNNSTFIRNLNEAGAVGGDPFRAGQAAIGGIRGQDADLEANVNRLYGNVRSMAGGDIPLDRKPFIDNIFNTLTRENRMAFLPKEIGDTLNQISTGQTPFTPQTVDMLKTMMATASRSSNDGNVRAALSIARNALESTPVNLPSVGPGLVTGQQAQVLRGATQQAGDVLSAMNEARRASAQRFGWQESARPIDAALGGAQPDNFLRQFVLNGTLDDARAVAQHAPREEVRNAILAHVKERALNGAADEVGKFSQSAYNKALGAIGDRKLALFFTPEELAQIRALGRVSSYAQNQPVGSAVNNSNTGALLLGRGYDALMGLADRVPVLGPMIVPPVRNIEIGIRNQQAQNVVPGLLQQQPRPPLGQGLLLPGIAAGGLLTTQ